MAGRALLRCRGREPNDLRGLPPLLLLVGCLLAARASTMRHALRWLLVVMILGTFVRPELALAFFAVVVVAA